MFHSVWPHRRQPTRLPRPRDSPVNNTGVGCHFLLQCMKVKCESEVAKSCPTLSNPMDCSLPGSSVHGIFQAGVLEWAATGHRAPSSNGYHGHAVSHRKTRCVFFKPWGSNLSQLFRIQFKGVRLELLAPILSWRIPDKPPRWKVVVESQEDTGILGPRRRRIQSGARDKAWSLRAFV